MWTPFLSAGVALPAAIMVCFPLQMLSGALSVMAGAGGASIISRSLGAGDVDRAKRAFCATSSFAFGVGLIVAVTVFVFLEQVLRLFGATEAIMPYAEDYLSVILLGVPLDDTAWWETTPPGPREGARIARLMLTPPF